MNVHRLAPDAILRPPGAAIARPKPEEVHVWLCDLNLFAPQEASICAFLSPEEMARAAHLRDLRGRFAFVMGRGLLRLILAKYLGLQPAAIRFQYSSLGKPSLAGPEPVPDLQFNLSHSGRWALYAVASKRWVGVDVEDSKRQRQVTDLIPLLFEPKERADLQALPEDALRKRILQRWTAREALLKARGEGLWRGSGHISLPPSRKGQAAGWTVHELDVGFDCVAALAASGPEWKVMSRSLEPGAWFSCQAG